MKSSLSLAAILPLLVSSAIAQDVQCQTSMGTVSLKSVPTNTVTSTNTVFTTQTLVKQKTTTVYKGVVYTGTVFTTSTDTTTMPTTTDTATITTTSFFVQTLEATSTTTSTVCKPRHSFILRTSSNISRYRPQTQTQKHPPLPPSTQPQRAIATSGIRSTTPTTRSACWATRTAASKLVPSPPARLVFRSCSLPPIPPRSSAPRWFHSPAPARPTRPSQRPPKPSSSPPSASHLFQLSS